MTSHKPLADAKAIEHLDWEVICQVHLHGFTKSNRVGTELAPACTAPATLDVTYHSVSRCVVVQLFMCHEHFRHLFANPEQPKDCHCGARRFISAGLIRP